MNRTATSLALFLAGLTVGIAVTAVVLYDRSESDQAENVDAVTASGPYKTMLVRLMVPEDGCWIRTIRDELKDEDEVTEGCGSVTFPVRVRKDISISFERSPPATWTWCLVAAVDGELVLTRGPDSNPAYSLDLYWAAPEFGGNPPHLQIEPVTCGEG